MFDKQLLIPPIIKHWDWETRLDGGFNSLLTRGEVMEIIDNFTTIAISLALKGPIDANH
jgi:hypothetical protein